MASLTQIRNKADAKLVEFWDALILKQESYWNKHGKFFQLLVTQSVVDGADATFEVIKPNDEKHPVDVDFSFNSPIPFQISVDEAVGDLPSFSMTVVVELLDGRKFTRSRKATPVITPAVWDESDPDNIIKTSPATISSWNLDTTAWTEVIEETI